MLNFENDTATNAQTVTVTEQLDPSFDWSTFEFGDIGFGSYVISVPPGRSSFSTQIDATATLGVLVDMSASLNLQTGLVTWTFTAVDPKTLDLPIDPTQGVLPPNNSSFQGQGFVTYTVQPNTNLATGTDVTAQATIVLNSSTTIQTLAVYNVIDSGPPTSSVNPLPATETTPSFTVSWSGHDDPGGSGVASYSIYVSDNGGPFTAWLTGTTLTAATYTGQSGHTYAFYSIATDNVGNVQPTPIAAQATTLVVASSPAVLQFGTAEFIADVSAGAGQITISRAGNLAAALTVVLSSAGGRGVAAFTRTVTIGPNTTSQPVTIPIANDGRPGESDATIPLSLSDPGSGASLGATRTASLVIHDDNPFPPPVVVQSVHWGTMKVQVGTGKKARTKSETALEIQFSGLVAGAGDLAAYQLSGVMTRKVKKQTVTTYKPIRLTSAVPASSPLTSMVSLLTATKPNVAQTDRLQIVAADLTDVYGRALDGNDDGQPGGNFVATIKGNSVTVAATRIANAAFRSPLTPEAVDWVIGGNAKSFAGPLRSSDSRPKTHATTHQGQAKKLGLPASEDLFRRERANWFGHRMVSERRRCSAAN
jgi:hypothetical protein